MKIGTLELYNKRTGPIARPSEVHFREIINQDLDCG